MLAQATTAAAGACYARARHADLGGRPGSASIAGCSGVPHGTAPSDGLAAFDAAEKDAEVFARVPFWKAEQQWSWGISPCRQGCRSPVLLRWSRWKHSAAFSSWHRLRGSRHDRAIMSDSGPGRWNKSIDGACGPRARQVTAACGAGV